jgi:hypothetical protein
LTVFLTDRLIIVLAFFLTDGLTDRLTDSVSPDATTGTILVLSL